MNKLFIEDIDVSGKKVIVRVEGLIEVPKVERFSFPDLIVLPDPKALSPFAFTRKKSSRLCHPNSKSIRDAVALLWNKKHSAMPANNPVIKNFFIMLSPLNLN